MSELELLVPPPARGPTQGEPAAARAGASPASGTPAISPARAALSALIGRSCSAPLWPQHPAEATLSLYPQQAAEAGAPDWRDPVVLSGAFGAIELADGVRLLRLISAIDLGGADSADWLHGAVLARLGGTPLAPADGLRRASLGTIDDECVLRIVLRGPDHVVACHGRASAAAWHALLGQSAWRREQLDLDQFAALPLGLPVLVARHRLSAARVQDLQAGDLIVPDSPAFACDGSGALRAGAALLRVQYNTPNSLTILDVENAVDQPELMMQYASDAPGDAGYEAHDERRYGGQQHDQYGAQAASGDGAPTQDNGALLASLPLTLEFVLGQVRLPLARLRELGPGAVLEVEGGTPGALVVECHGRRLGTAEIVDIDGRLGVRLLQWGSAQ